VRGLILAGGRGSRMGAATASQPKCLTPLAGRPLLSWQLDALRAAGIGPIAIATGYRAELIADAADAHFHNPRWAETNMVQTLATAAPWLEEAPLLVSYGDIVYRPDAVRALTTATADLAITYDTRWWELWSARFADPLADAETFRLDGAYLATIGERAATREEIQGQYMGLLRFTPTAWAAARRHVSDTCDMTTLLRQLLADGLAIEAVPVEGGWCEVDHEADAALYERLSAAPWSHDWRWA
jgi:choline kinase